MKQTITTTKWRDVPFETLCVAYRAIGNRDEWERYRGKMVQIETDVLYPDDFKNLPPGPICGGPYWRVVGTGGRQACAHIIEVD